MKNKLGILTLLIGVVVMGGCVDSLEDEKVIQIPQEIIECDNSRWEDHCIKDILFSRCIDDKCKYIQGDMFFRSHECISYCRDILPVECIFDFNGTHVTKYSWDGEREFDVNWYKTPGFPDCNFTRFRMCPMYDKDVDVPDSSSIRYKGEWICLINYTAYDEIPTTTTTTTSTTTTLNYVCARNRLYSLEYLCANSDKPNETWIELKRGYEYARYYSQGDEHDWGYHIVGVCEKEHKRPSSSMTEIANSGDCRSYSSEGIMDGGYVRTFCQFHAVKEMLHEGREDVRGCFL